MASAVEQDLQSFMSIILMTIGCLVIVLVINTLVIVSNPDMISITTVIHAALYEDGREVEKSGTPFPNGNKTKEPFYIDVHRDRLILYPGEEVVPLADLQREENAFERFVANVAEHAKTEYVVLLVRPRTANVARRLKKVIKANGLDIGYELFEAGRKVNYVRVKAKNPE